MKWMSICIEWYFLKLHKTHLHKTTPNFKTSPPENSWDIMFEGHHVLHQNSEILPALWVYLFWLQCLSPQSSSWPGGKHPSHAEKVQINFSKKVMLIITLVLFRNWNFGDLILVKDQPTWQDQVIHENKIVACLHEFSTVFLFQPLKNPIKGWIECCPFKLN